MLCGMYLINSFFAMFLSGFNYVSFPVKSISYKQKTEIFLAQTRITGHFLILEPTKLVFSPALEEFS